MGDVMNPLSPEKILRNLDHGYFMTHQEQAEAAQYIRQLQQENLTLLGKREWVGLTDDEIVEVWGNTPMMLNARDGGARKVFAHAIEAKLKEKNGAL